jgi:Flp pilus assembly protein TadG
MLAKSKRNKNKLQHPRGQSLVEFALLLPMLLLLVLGAMDFGRLFFTKIVLTNAAREGANYLAWFPKDAEEGYINTYNAIESEANSSTVDVNALSIEINDCCTPGLPVEVKVSTTVTLVFENALQWLGLMDLPVQLTGTVKMVVQ